MMKKTWSIFGIAVLSLVPVLSGVAQPSIQFDKQSFDFGVAYPHQKLVEKFIFWNKGDQPLEISKVRTSCGCTAAVLSATSILPNASGIISVTMTTSAPMKKVVTATVVSNDPKQPEFRLEMVANVRNLWEFSPKSSYVFSNVPFDTEQSLTLWLKSVNDTPFKILSTKLMRPSFSAQVGDLSEKGLPITITLHAGKQKKTITDSLQILTDNPKQPRIRISVFATVVGYIQFNRRRVYFGNVPKGESKSIIVTAKLPEQFSDQELEITEITSDKNNITGKVTGKRPDGTVILELTFTAPKKPGYHTGQIILKTNIDAEPVTTLPYSALIRVRPRK